MPELKPGDSVTYEIGDKKLILTPMPWGRLKKAFKLFSDSWAELDKDTIADQAKFMKWLAVSLESRMGDMFPLILDTKINTFLDADWVDENITLLHIQQIVNDAIIVNGVRDFLAMGGKAKTPSQPPILEPAELKAEAI